MRIVFIGTVEFSKKALEKIISVGGDVVSIFTLKESNFNSDFCDLSNIGKINNIPVFYCEDINSNDNVNRIKKLKPDIIFCFGWSSLLKKPILSIAPKGVVGFHPASLPANRGRHPLIWALILDLKVTASTFFFMDHEADSGDILSQEPILIDEHDDARSLYDKVIATALMQIEKFLPKLENDNYKRTKQDKKLANVWRKRGKKDGIIDWRMSAMAIKNLIRGLSKPYIGARFSHKNNEYIVWKAEFVENNIKNIEPGKVIGLENSDPIIKCGSDCIKLTEVEPTLIINTGEYL
tara:strand:- start:1431 stop:2312 length:882 start_codon:yes stop_codon:yes gene_type:complete